MPVKIVTQASLDQKKLLGPGNGEMTEKDFNEAHKAFLDRVLYQGNSSLTDDQKSFLHGELKALVSDLAGTERLVIIHLGLEGTMMRYGFSFRVGTPSGNGLDYTPADNPTHILDDSDFKPITPLEWKPFHDAYRADVYLKRGDGAAVKVDDNDAFAVVLHWDEEIDKMYQQTTNGIKDDFRIRISSVSVEHDHSDGGRVGYRHGVSFHCERKVLLGWKPMLDDDMVVIYRNKAADYGNLCPPRTGRFERVVK